MPNPPMHIQIAHEASMRLDHPVLNDNMGYVLLGSTSPDIRALTRGRREDYHFTRLDFDSVGAGVAGLFGTHPRLRDTSGLDHRTQAFIAGYISHLVGDETWVVEMFRPFFGNPDVFECGVKGEVYDRALQLDLDRFAKDADGSMLKCLSEADGEVDVGFIPWETLAEWRGWVQTLLGREFSWDRLRFMARRIARGDDSHPAHRVAGEFLEDVPKSLRDLYSIVPRQSVERFKERAVENLVAAMGDFLS